MSVLLGKQNVSRETFDALKYFSDLVCKWTAKINLIAPSTVPEIWERHIIDSAQIYSYAPKNMKKWVDIGSGGGFPGIVVAIIAKSADPDREFVLIESDQRKSTFLRTAARELDLQTSIITSRIEKAPPQGASVVSARALTSLYSMMPLLDHHTSAGGCALLHKGRRYQEEVAEASRSWAFGLEEHPSLTDPDARILAITGITRVE